MMREVLTVFLVNLPFVLQGGLQWALMEVTVEFKLVSIGR
jgi:hypothetical protein